MRAFALIFAIVANLALADGLVKEFAAKTLQGSAALSVIPGLFNLAYVENRGCAWGLFQGQVWPLAVFAIAAFALLVWKRKTVFAVPERCPAPRFARIALDWAERLLYAGIVGNLLDRLVRGYVIDMFDWHIGIHHFPCFNLADTYITVAAGLMLLVGFLPGRKAGAAN